MQTMIDTRPEYAKRLEVARIARGFKTAKSACIFFGWNYNSYAQHEQGNRGISRVSAKYAKAYRVSEAWLLTGEGTGPTTSNTDPNSDIDREFNQLVAEATGEDKQAILPILRTLIASRKR
ncbi:MULTISPECIES: XRE family transcriptional regulator [unclassified Brucella]|uniref:XRE family transcriptional regulator n=1 Tax=unclassified Brucella TaxID=2632610 RepID=UPI002877B8F8|nr:MULTISPECIES: XRE family transcriptional regulator [unclassified Brucella]